MNYSVIELINYSLIKWINYLLIKLINYSLIIYLFTWITGEDMYVPDGYDATGDYSAIPGRRGVDYPIFSYPPETDFYCAEQKFPGYYADDEALCQVSCATFHWLSIWSHVVTRRVAGLSHLPSGRARQRLPLSQRHAVQSAVFRLRLVVQCELQPRPRFVRHQCLPVLRSGFCFCCDVLQKTFCLIESAWLVFLLFSIITINIHILFV